MLSTAQITIEFWELLYSSWNVSFSILQFRVIIYHFQLSKNRAFLKLVFNFPLKTINLLYPTWREASYSPKYSSFDRGRRGISKYTPQFPTAGFSIIVESPESRLSPGLQNPSYYRSNIPSFRMIEFLNDKLTDWGRKRKSETIEIYDHMLK